MFGRKKKLNIETVDLDNEVQEVADENADIVEETEKNEEDDSNSIISDSSDGIGNNIVEESKEDTTESNDETVVNNEEEHGIKKERLLYIVSDRVSRRFKEYVVDVGLNVEDIFSELESARDSMLLQFEDYRMVIVDTGTGKFTSVTARKELIDMIGIMDEQTSVSIFYTDEALKSEAKVQLGKKYKGIHWCKYEGTPKMVAEIMKLGEDYIGKECNIGGIDRQIEERFKGDEVHTLAGDEKFRYRRELMGVSDIVENTIGGEGDDNEDLLRVYEEVV